VTGVDASGATGCRESFSAHAISRQSQSKNSGEGGVAELWKAEKLGIWKAAGLQQTRGKTQFDSISLATSP